ncbi:MAG TPA: right-handed parallel beta-helix repeat-containing protein [bacterium]|nr:right-handed parallel beta-helix repeat-containing protein [bacterium]
MRNTLASISLTVVLLVFSGFCAAQATVVVSGIQDDNTNSRPTDEEGDIYNDRGQYYGPEGDKSYETLSAAVDDLMDFGNGGTVVIASAAPAEGHGLVTKPITLVGSTETSSVAGALTVQGSHLVVNNIYFVTAGGLGTSSAVRVEGGSIIEMTNVHFQGRGLAVYGEGLSEITIQNCEFVNTYPNGLTGMGSEMTVDIRNTEFRDIKNPCKCVVVIPGSGVANTTIRDCTFSSSRLGIDDRHVSGDSIYENLIFKDMDWIGINVEWEPWRPLSDDVFTSVNNCVFENVAFQGLHFHGTKNVAVENVTARRCGSINARSEDGAGIGGHDGNRNITLENCDSSENFGSGFCFETGDRTLVLSTNIALNNGRNGMRFIQCEDVTVQLGNWISGNQENGIYLYQTQNWNIYNNLIGLNRQGTAVLANRKNGILLWDVGSGRIGSDTDLLRGNIISGNIESGIDIRNSVNGQITIATNKIGTDGEGGTPIPNQTGITLNVTTIQSGSVVIGGDNPSFSLHRFGDLGAGNLISGNKTAGIAIEHLASEMSYVIYRIWGNYIGTDVTGMHPLPNEAQGILVNGGDTGYFPSGSLFIGDADYDAKGNLISGNGDCGISMLGRVKNVAISKNLIGLAVNGTSEVKNQSHGINLSDGPQETEIKENVIWYNNGYGILLDKPNTIKNRITKNSIHRNEKDGIRLTNWANNRINSPTLNRIFLPGRSLSTLSGQTNGATGPVQIFVDPPTTESGYWGQGRTFIRELVPDEKGKFTIDLNSIPYEGMITATASDADGNTSEFSPFLNLAVTQTTGYDGRRLAANKNTVFRVFGDTGKGTARFATTGTLTLGAGGAPINPANAFEIAPFGYYDTRKADRKQAADSLNFYVDTPPEGFQPVEVVLSSNGRERGRLESSNLVFQKMKDFRVGIVPVVAPIRAGGLATATPDLTVVQDTMRYFADVYPLSRPQVMNTYRVLSATSISYRPHSNPTQRTLVLTVQSIHNNSRPKPDYSAGIVSYDTFLNPPGVGGILFGYTWMDIPQVVVMLDRVSGGVPPQHNGSTLAHEIGHTVPFLLGDTYQGGATETVNPLHTDPAERDGFGNHVMERFYGFSPTGALDLDQFSRPGPVFSEIAPATPTVYDIMGNTDPAWIDPVTYNRLFDKLVAEAGAPKMPLLNEDSSVLIVHGLISRSDTVELLPMDFDTQYPQFAAGNTQGTQYQVSLLDGNGVVLESQDLCMTFLVSMRGRSEDGSPSATYEPTEISPFNVCLRDDPAGQRIEIKKDGNVLAFLDKSPSTPVITDLWADTPGGQVAGSLDLHWSAIDQDPGQTENLFFDVLYTPDNRETIIPIAVDMADMHSLTIDPSTLPGSDEGRFIVRASDGWNQDEAILDEAMQLKDRTPSVSILRPIEDSELVVTLPMLFSAAVYDPEDGTLQGDSLVWTSAHDGAMLGHGTDLLIHLPLGRHTIRLTATDSSGNLALDEVTVHVVESPTNGEWIENWMLH